MREIKDDDREDRSSLVEDTLGFNLRSLRTLADLWIRPRAVMDAIVARDRETYTPMIRLFLALIGAQVVVSILWGGYSGLLETVSSDGGGAGALGDMLETTGVEREAFFSVYGNLAAVLHAPIVGGFTAMSAFVLTRFGERRRFSVNLNLVFAALTAGSLVGLALLGVLLFGDTYASWTTLVIAFAYFITWLRGAPASVARTRSGRLVKSLVMALVMITLVIIGGTLMQVLAITGALLLA